MDNTIKTKWLTALRSGEYRQGQNVLKQQFGENDKPAFCCLGVLCDIAIKEGLDVTVADRNDSDDSTIYRVYEYDGCEELLPASVREWAGLDAENPEVLHPNGENEEMADVASLNDSGYTFTDIADVIEKSL